MSINGKRNGFEKVDLVHVGQEIGIHQSNRIVNDIITVVENWNYFADQAGVDKTQADAIFMMLCLFF